MKKLISLLLVVFCLVQVCDAQNVGVNQGYYGAPPQPSNKQLGQMAKNAGGNSTRLFLNIQDYQANGMSPYQNDIVFAYDSLGMRHNIFNLSAETYAGTYTGQDTSHVSGNRTWLPAGLYLNPFNIDSSINTSNIWANYVYNVVNSVGYAFDYFEVWNEPDFTSNFEAAAYDSTQYSGSWEKVTPAPVDLSNLNPPNGMADYVQLCKITKQVLNHIKPTAKVCTGGIGYPWFYMWFLRGGGQSWVDILDYHTYPHNTWAWYPSIEHKNSDFAASWAIDTVLLGGHTNQGNYSANNFRYSETVTGSSHLPAMITETNIPSTNYTTDTSYLGKARGYPQMFANYFIKLTSKAIKKGVITSTIPLIFFAEGATEDSSVITSGNEYNSMGWYNNLNTHTFANATLTPQGFASAAQRRLLNNYTLDGTQPTFPTGIDGERYDSAGNKIYKLWANQYAARNGDSTITASYAVPTGATAKYSYNGTAQATPSGTQTISDPVYYVVPNGSTPVGPTLNCTTSPKGFGIRYFGMMLTALPNCANQGTSYTITLPLDSLQLSHTAIAGTCAISSYKYNQVLGAVCTIAQNGNTAYFKNMLTTGRYVFSCLVTDSCGKTVIAYDTVNVNPASTSPTFQCTLLPAGTIKGGSNLTFTISGSATGTGSVTLFDNPAKSYNIGSKSLSKPNANSVQVVFKNGTKDFVYGTLGSGNYTAKITCGSQSQNINFTVKY